MALASFIAGAYTGTMAASALGITKTGYKLSWESKAEMLEESDVYGMMVMDFLALGTNWYCQTEFLEANGAAPIASAYPWGSMGVQGIIARLATDVAGALVLTATASTPAASSPASLTASKAILTPGFQPELLYSSRLRTLPCKFSLLPYVSTGLRNFTLA